MVNKHDYITQKDFFINLVNQANISGENKGIILSQYYQFFKGILPFSLNNFEKLILELSGKKIQTSGISPSSNLLNEDGTSSSLRTVVSQKEDLTYDPVSLLNTSNISHAVKQQVGFGLKVTRIQSNETIVVNSSLFKIGKSEDGNDYAISDNRAISRQHAEIRVRNNQAFLVDCNSTNGVKINGKKIKPSVEYKIKRGDKIHLANEEFLVE